MTGQPERVDPLAESALVNWIPDQLNGLVQRFEERSKRLDPAVRHKSDLDRTIKVLAKTVDKLVGNTSVGPPRARSKGGLTERIAETLMAADGPLTRAQLSERLEMPPGPLGNALKHMLAAEDVSEDEEGVSWAR